MASRFVESCVVVWWTHLCDSCNILVQFSSGVSISQVSYVGLCLVYSVVLCSGVPN